VVLLEAHSDEKIPIGAEGTRRAAKVVEDVLDEAVRRRHVDVSVIGFGAWRQPLAMASTVCTAKGMVWKVKVESWKNCGAEVRRGWPLSVTTAGCPAIRAAVQQS